MNRIIRASLLSLALVSFAGCSRSPMTETVPAPLVDLSDNPESAGLREVPAPQYPALAKNAGVEGQVRAEVIFGVDGRVESARILSGPVALHDAVLAALARWEVNPEVRPDAPSRLRLEPVFEFRLGAPATLRG